MNALDRLMNYLNKTTEQDSYHQIIEIMLQNLDVIKTSTIYETAALCYTSTATIGRICKLMGYSGYTEFHKKLVEVLENYEYYNNPIPSEKLHTEAEVKSSMQQILQRQAMIVDEIEEKALLDICDMLHEYDNIFYFNYGDSPENIRVLSINLIMSGKHFHYYGEIAEGEEFLQQLPKNSITIFCLPMLEHTVAMRDLQRRMQEQNEPTFLITTNAEYQEVRFINENRQYQLEIPGCGSSLDMIPIQIMWSMVAILYRSKFM